MNMKKYSKALEENIIHSFTVETIGWDIPGVHGILKKSDRGIKFQVLNGLEGLQQVELERQLLNINFYSISTSFQVQHNALYWLKKHDLFTNLIANDQFQEIQGGNCQNR